MRGTVSEKLSGFLEQVNIAAEEARQNNIAYIPEVVRGNLDKLAAFIPQGPELAFVEDRVFKAATHNISARVYSPVQATENSVSNAKKLPVLLHFHGGGHMCGSVDLYDPISRKLAVQGHCIVICVEYRLAPEYPYPAGLDDCEYALINYKEILTGLNFNEQVYILGDSAGGAICTSLSMRAAHNSAIKIDKQILVYPSVDYSMRLPSIDENGDRFLLEKPRIIWYFENYFQSNESRIEVSPLYNMHKNIAPSLVITAGCDPLRDEGLAYVEALEQSGNKVEHHHFSGMIHAYMLLESMVESECAQTYQYITNFIKA